MMLSIASNLVIIKLIVFVINHHFAKVPKILIFDGTIDCVTKMIYAGDRNRSFDYVHAFLSTRLMVVSYLKNYHHISM